MFFENRITEERQIGLSEMLRRKQKDLKTKSRKNSSLSRLNEKGRTVDVLAYRAEEGRSKRRNASGSRKQTTIRGYPNGGTHPS